MKDDRKLHIFHLPHGGELPCFCKSGIWRIWLCFGCAFAAKLQVLAETGRATLSNAELRWFCLVFQKLRQRLRHIFLRMALSLLRAWECCQAVMCSSGSYSNPQKDQTGRKVASNNYSGKLLWIQFFVCILFLMVTIDMIFEPRFCISCLSAVRKLRKAAASLQQSDFIWGWAAEVENVPRKNVDARKNPTSGSWAALFITFLIQEGSV